MVSELVGQVYAKVNLTLDVLGKRADGLHEIATVIQTISLADRITFSLSRDVTLRLEGMPLEAENLILGAVRSLRQAARVDRGVAIHCRKRIPISAGLGGGSADAAATLRALNQLWSLDMTAVRLLEIAADLGADVPAALIGGTVIATGTGRDVTQIGRASCRERV